MNSASRDSSIGQIFAYLFAFCGAVALCGAVDRLLAAEGGIPSDVRYDLCRDGGGVVKLQLSFAGQRVPRDADCTADPWRVAIGKGLIGGHRDSLEGPPIQDPDVRAAFAQRYRRDWFATYPRFGCSHAETDRLGGAYMARYGVPLRDDSREQLDAIATCGAGLLTALPRPDCPTGWTCEPLLALPPADRPPTRRVIEARESHNGCGFYLLSTPGKLWVNFRKDACFEGMPARCWSPSGLVASCWEAAPPPAPRCGDGTCDAGETCSSCAADCGGCPPGPEPPGDEWACYAELMWTAGEGVGVTRVAPGVPTVMRFGTPVDLVGLELRALHCEGVEVAP